MGIHLRFGGTGRSGIGFGCALVAVVTAVSLITPAIPAMADGPGGPPPVGGGGLSDTCAQGPGGATGVTVGYPGSPASSTLGLTLPALNPQPVDTDAVIAPNPGETFAPITLTQVSATPMPKVLKDGTIDPAQAVMEWRFRVQQQCPDNGPMVTCDFFYHEMADGSVWEIATLPDGTLFEHAFRVECLGGWTAFHEPGLPPDIGARLLAAAKANVDSAALLANATTALGTWVAGQVGVPALVLPPDMATWVGAISSAIGVGAMLSGACGGAFVGVLTSEIGVWTQLLTLSYAPPGARIPKAVIAVSSKVASTISLVSAISICTAQSVASSGTLAALYELMAALSAIIWWSSTALLVVYGLDYAISYWQSS